MTSQPNNYIKNIAIVGAAGEQGSFIVSALLARGNHTLTAITRPSSTSTFPPSLHIVRASYSDHAALVSALQNQDVLIITLNVTAPPESQKQLIDAAIEAGVKFIMPNEWGADYSNPALAEGTLIGQGARKVREYIERKGGVWIALTCSFWYEFSLAGGERRFGFDFQKKKVTFFDDGGNVKICTSTWPRAAEAVSSLLSLPIHSPSPSSPCISNWSNKPLYTTSFLISQHDIFASILRVTGDDEAAWTMTSESAEERYKNAEEAFKGGETMALANMLYSRIFFRSGEGNFGDKVQNELLGLGEESLDEATKVAVEYAAKGLILGRDRENMEAREKVAAGPA